MPLVLAVDDHPDLCFTVAALARFINCEVIAVHDGKRALEVLDERRVELMILDYHMPVMSGLDVLRTLRARKVPADHPFVVMCTADDEARGEAMRLGAVGFISKGGDTCDELLAAMERYAGCTPERPVG